MTVHITSIVEKSPGMVNAEDLRRLAIYFRKQSLGPRDSDYVGGMMDTYENVADDIRRIADNIEHGLNMDEAIVTQ